MFSTGLSEIYITRLARQLSLLHCLAKINCLRLYFTGGRSTPVFHINCLFGNSMEYNNFRKELFFYSTICPVMLHWHSWSGIIILFYIQSPAFRPRQVGIVPARGRRLQMHFPERLFWTLKQRDGEMGESSTCWPALAFLLWLRFRKPWMYLKEAYQKDYSCNSYNCIFL